MKAVPLKPIEVLLANLIDYAGLFPPAGLTMQAAVDNYALYRCGPHAWALGRFIVPVARLHEFEAAAVELLPHDAAAEPWQLSVLAGTELAPDLAVIEQFNQHHGTAANGLAVIDMIEIKATTADQIAQAGALLPATLTPYFELLLGDDLDTLIAQLAAIDGRAKLRTGGVMPELFPSSDQLLRFMSACMAASIPFKATAGLHHALRGDYRLTYEPESAAAPMYGFLNVWLAAAALQAGVEQVVAQRILEERSSAAFQWDAGGVLWHEEHLSIDTLVRTRRHVAVSFGSCSFTEPLDELTDLGLV